MLQVVPRQALFDVTPIVDPMSGASRLCLRGELDMTGAALLLAAVDEAGDRATEVVIDLSALGFLDLHGLRAILRAWRQSPVPVQLIVGGSPVRRLFELTDLAHLIDVRGLVPAPARGVPSRRTKLAAADAPRLWPVVVLAEAG